MTRLEAAVAELVAALRDELRQERPAERVELLSVEAAAERAGIGRSLAYSLIRSGELRSVRVHRRRLVPSDAIAALAAQKRAAASETATALEDRDATSSPTRKAA